MLHIRHPSGYLPERSYIYDVLFNEFLGLDYQMEMYAGQDVQITLQDDPEERVLIIPDLLFQTPELHWLAPAALPMQPLYWWNSAGFPGNPRLTSNLLPIIYGRAAGTQPLYQEVDADLILGPDLFGSIFFMLTRYEECVKQERDTLGRFPARAALAYQEDFLERPLVNEYLELLWAALTYLWPKLQRKPRSHRIYLSHDVDHPLCTVGKPWTRTLKSGLGDIVLRRDITLALQRVFTYLHTRHGPAGSDPCNTFDFIMDESEAYGRQSAFYFITDHSAGAIDGDYSIDHCWIRQLIRHIHERGHEVGLHPSYNTYRDPVQTERELQKLLQATAEEGICQAEWGGRQHYLRWENPTTWQNWADAGLGYDSTLSFAEQVGFRCGTCYEYPVFNLKTRQRLALRERPLIVMEASLFGYMHLAWEASLQKILCLNAICKQFDGDFTLLWHNNNLISNIQKQQYRTMCQSL